MEVNDKDLRIGNYVNEPKGHLHRVERTAEYTRRVRYGVLLSKEWLRKAGCKEGYWYLSLTNLKAELHFEFYGNEVVTILRSDFCEMILDPLKYVHDLQNLYKGLAREELKFNEPQVN